MTPTMPGGTQRASGRRREDAWFVRGDFAETSSLSRTATMLAEIGVCGLPNEKGARSQALGR